MSDRKPCVRCGRLIDAYARACPFCSWDQSAAPPPKLEAPAEPAYVPPGEHRFRGRIIAVGAFVALAVIAFVVGTFIHGFDASEVKAAQKNGSRTTTALAPAQRNPVTLVPITDTNPAPVEQPITSAPAQAPGQQPNDATALPSTEYAAVAARAKAQQKEASVDPRTIKAAPFETPKPAPYETPQPALSRRTERELPPPMTSAQEATPAEPRQHVVRTEPVPEYQPVPEIRVDRDTTARLLITVGPDGHVKDIEIANSIPGETSKLIQAVQSWRFRPATENGLPVTGRVSVAITIRANE